jgi:cobalt/nickel transport system permease protein
VVVLLLRVLPRTERGLAVTAFVASLVSVVIAALGFLGQYRLGGGVVVDGQTFGELALLMTGVHLAIGVGEGLIAAVTVVTVARTRPDLVYALRGAGLRRPATPPGPVARPHPAGTAGAP